jgi:hypothetical protein
MVAANTPYPGTDNFSRGWCLNLSVCVMYVSDGLSPLSPGLVAVLPQPPGISIWPLSSADAFWS